MQELTIFSQSLIRDNHGHLVTLGVSHPSLEMIVAATAAEPFGLATKLTGAGGGGCAVTLIPDGESRVIRALHSGFQLHHVCSPASDGLLITTISLPGIFAPISAFSPAERRLRTPPHHPRWAGTRRPRVLGQLAGIHRRRTHPRRWGGDVRAQTSRVEGGG